MELEAGKTIMAASSRVFNTRELLETILAAINPATVIRFRRINRFFTNTTDKSPTIQKKLFLKNDAELSQRFWIYIYPGPDGVYAASYASDDLNKAIFDYHMAHPSCRTIGRRYVFNPLLFRARALSGRPIRWTNQVAFRVSPAFFFEQNGADLITSMNLCGKMFITKPAVSKFVVVVEGDGRLRTRCMQKESGIRFIDILMEIRECERISSILLLAEPCSMFVSEEQRVEIEGR